MHGENGFPVTPDWLPDSPRCSTCNSRETYCRFIGDKLNASCCDECSHGLKPLPLPALWDGDQV